MAESFRVVGKVKGNGRMSLLVLPPPPSSSSIFANVASVASNVVVVSLHLEYVN